MLDNREAEAAAAGISELLLDWGGYLTGGRRATRPMVLLTWVLTFGGALGLWRWFPWLFDHFPGWAVLAGGCWVILFVIALGLFGAAVKYSPLNQASDVDGSAGGRTTC